jgi:hypothetical protein
LIVGQSTAGGEVDHIATSTTVLLRRSDTRYSWAILGVVPISVITAFSDWPGCPGTFCSAMRDTDTPGAVSEQLLRSWDVAESI